MPPRTISLRLPLEPAWHLALDPSREWAVLPEYDSELDRAFVAGRGWLACRDTGDDSELWRAALSFNPVWLTTVNGSLIVAGDNGMARLSAADGQPVWQFLVPKVAPWFDRPGWQDPDAIAPVERLSGFQFAGGRLVARLGSRWLIALDGSTGQLAWQRSAPLAREYCPAYLANDQCVVAQSSDGQRWIFDSTDGHTLHTGPAPVDPWPTPPVALPGGRILVLEDGKLVALDRSTWEPAWTWALPRPVSLTGALPQTRLSNGTLLVGVPRNDCYEVERLNPDTGWPLSNSGVAIDRDTVDLHSLAFDGDRFFIATHGELKAINCHTGSVEFRRSLEKFLPDPGLPEVRTTVRIQSVANGLLMWTIPGRSPKDMPQPPAGILVWDQSECERQPGLGNCSSLGIGPGNDLRAVRIDGNNLIVASDAEIRAYRGLNREAK